MMKRLAWAWVVAALLALTVSGLRADDGPGDGSAAQGVIAISRPKDDVTMSFALPAQVAQIYVKEGETVKAGQPLVRFDDRQEVADYNKAKADADNMTKIEVQKAVWEQAKVHYERLLKASLDGAVTPEELDEAKIQVTVEHARLDMENFNHQQAQLEMASKKAVLDKMTLLSPINGRVEKLYLQVGESVDSGNPRVVHVENRDPLWVEGNVPFALAAKLHEGDPATVVYSDRSTARGKVIFIAGVADPASGTLRVKVQVANPELRRAGEQVRLLFPDAGRLAQLQNPNQ